jgi:signal transduction histidine kinase
MAVAAGATAINLLFALSFMRDMDPARWAWGSVLLVAHGGALAFRRKAPRAVFAVNLATGLAVVAVGLPMVVLTLTPLIAVYTVASLYRRSVSWWAPVAAAATMGLIEAMVDTAGDAGTIVGNLLAIAGSWLIGSFVYQRQEYVAQLEQRTRQLEEAREQLAEKAVTEERMRIARELHDIVAHGLGTIAVQSGVGAHVIDRRPDEAKKALTAIEEASREALDEMRRLLGVLRDGDGAADLDPAPGIAQIPELVDKVSLHGPAVGLKIHGEARPLPQGAELTAYRIVQESLTNVLKHSFAGNVRVAVTYGPGSLVLEITDDGTARSRVNGSGSGIEGMRERVHVYGGTLEAGPLRDGGFRVRAEIPVAEDAG